MADTPAAAPTAEEQAKDLYEMLKREGGEACSRSYVLARTPVAMQAAMLPLVDADYPAPEPDPNAPKPPYPGDAAVGQMAAQAASAAAAEAKKGERNEGDAGALHFFHFTAFGRTGGEWERLVRVEVRQSLPKRGGKRRNAGRRVTPHGGWSRRPAFLSVEF